MDYSISELSSRSPNMSDTDFAAFVEDIRTNGQLVPIWVCGDEVIDGRKRLAACRQLGIAPAVVNLAPDQDAEAVARALNVLRTHYTTSQRAMFAAERVNASRGDNRPDIRKNTDVVTAAEAAREAGVNTSTVEQAKRIRRDAAPEVTRAVKAGKLSVHSALEIVRSVPKSEQPGAVTKVVTATKSTPVAKALTGSDVRRDRPNPNAAPDQFAIAVQKLEVAAEVITQHAEAAASDIRRKDFLEALRHVRTALTRAINTMEIAA